MCFLSKITSMGTPDTRALSICVFVVDGEFYRYKAMGGNLPLIRHSFKTENTA